MLALRLRFKTAKSRKKSRTTFPGHPATCPDDDNIDLFVGLVKEVVKNIDPQRIQISEYLSTDDSISYGTFDSAALDALTERCAIYFLPDQLASLRRFVETHGNGCDVMTLVL
jgi:hypothetical protein